MRYSILFIIGLSLWSCECEEPTLHFDPENLPDPFTVTLVEDSYWPENDCYEGIRVYFNKLLDFQTISLGNTMELYINNEPIQEYNGEILPMLEGNFAYGFFITTKFYCDPDGTRTYLTCGGESCTLGIQLRSDLENPEASVRSVEGQLLNGDNDYSDGGDGYWEVEFFN